MPSTTMSAPPPTGDHLKTIRCHELILIYNAVCTSDDATHASMRGIISDADIVRFAKRKASRLDSVPGSHGLDARELQRPKKEWMERDKSFRKRVQDVKRWKKHEDRVAGGQKVYGESTESAGSAPDGAPGGTSVGKRKPIDKILTHESPGEPLPVSASTKKSLILTDDNESDSNEKPSDETTALQTLAKRQSFAPTDNDDNDGDEGWSNERSRPDVARKRSNRDKMAGIRSKAPVLKKTTEVPVRQARRAKAVPTSPLRKRPRWSKRRPGLVSRPKERSKAHLTKMAAASSESPRISREPAPRGKRAREIDRGRRTSARLTWRRRMSGCLGTLRGGLRLARGSLETNEPWEQALDSYVSEGSSVLDWTGTTSVA